MNIYLRAPEEADVDKIFLWENDRGMWESSPAAAPVSRLQVWQYVQNYDADPLRAGELRMMAIDRDSGATVGHADLFEIDAITAGPEWPCMSMPQPDGKDMAGPYSTALPNMPPSAWDCISCGLISRSTTLRRCPFSSRPDTILPDACAPGLGATPAG